MPTIIDNDTGRQIDSGYQEPAREPASRRGEFIPGSAGDGLNAFHLLFFALLLGGVMMAVIALLGGG